MPPRKRTSSVLNGDSGDLPKEADRVTNADDARAAAEEAEAEAAEAEAMAAAARARARAIRLRREAAAVETASTAAEPESSAIELDEPTVVDQPAAKPVQLVKTKSVIETVAADESIGDADEDEPEAVDEAAEKPARSRRRPSRQLVVKVVAATLVIVASLGLLGLSSAMYVHHRNVEAQRQLSAEFSAAARQSVVTLMSLDFNKAEDDVKRIIDNTTGDFKKDFEGQSQDFIDVAKQSKVVTEATVNAVAVQSMTKDTATVLVAVVTNVSNAASNKQDPRSWRLSVDVTRDGDQIKLSKVEFVP
jgi:Mce-associated membrane protein